jgi:hypothetical protein
MHRSLTKTVWAHRHWSQSRNPGIKSTIHGPRSNIAHCARPRDRKDDSNRIQQPLKQPEGRRGIAAVCAMLGRSLRRRSAQRLTPGTRCQYLWDLRRDRKIESKGCPDRTFLNEPSMVAGRGSVRQLHHASLHCVHSAERPSGMRKINFSSSGILSSQSSAARARYFCNGKTVVFKRTIVLKKFSGFLDISQ